MDCRSHLIFIVTIECTNKKSKQARALTKKNIHVNIENI